MPKIMNENSWIKVVLMKPEISDITNYENLEMANVINCLFQWNHEMLDLMN